MAYRASTVCSVPARGRDQRDRLCAVQELRQTLLASFAGEQQRQDGALPALQERIEASVRAHERAAQELLHGLEARLAEQRRLQSGELGGVRDALGAALETTKQQAALTSTYLVYCG